MVYIMLGTGFEETEAVAPGDVLRRAQIPMQYVGIGGRLVEGAHGITLRADITAEEMDLDSMDMIVLPGGMGGVESIEASAEPSAFSGSNVLSLIVVVSISDYVIHYLSYVNTGRRIRQSSI